MVDVEIIDFKTPTGAAKLLFLTKLKSEEHDEGSLTNVLTGYFSRWGLLFTVKVISKDDPDKTFIAYVRYYSAMATASARRHNEGEVSLEDGKIRFRISRSGSQKTCNLPLSRSKCEELAN